MPLDLHALNDSQREAVLWGDGPLLVLAGPGSGKTRVLTMRVAHLLEADENASVLALTFTSRAATEMRQRVEALLGERSDRTHLGTFHAFSTDVLRQHGGHLGLRPDFMLLSQDEDRVELLRGIVAELSNEGFTMPTDLQSVLRFLDGRFADAYEGEAVDPALQETPAWLPSLFARYCAEMISSNRVDFSGLLFFVRKLLRDHQHVGNVVRAGWSHVCVDEFQDTNKAQYELLRVLIAQQAPNLFIVADDDQIMYQWNGASPERLASLRADFDIPIVQLPENYRCPAEIVHAANKLIAFNRIRTPDKRPLVTLRPADLTGATLRYAVYDGAQNEAAAVVSDMQTRNLAPSLCAVLARAGKQLEPVASALVAAGIEPYLATRKNQFQSPLVRVMVHALRLANARHDLDLLRRLCVAWNALTGAEVEVVHVGASAELMGGDFLRSWSTAVLPAQGIPLALASKIRDCLVDRLEFPLVVDWFLAEAREHWLEKNDLLLAEELSTWQEIHDEIIHELSPSGVVLNQYLQKMDLAPKTPRPAPGAVRLLTVHGSKGLEFEHVYLIGMAQEVFPAFQALKQGAQSRELEEERRNCFVAITRTLETLTLTRSKTYGGWSKPASQFLSEMGISP